MRFSILKIVKDQLTPLPAVEPVDLTGRVALVTGANVGLGLEAARHLAAMSPDKLVITSRDAKKGEDARKSIVDSHPAANVEVWSLDLADLSSVVAFAERAKRELNRLDLALLNAGVAIPSWSTTKDGYEMVLQVNAIATGLLGVLLLPLLQKTAKLSPPSTSASYKPHLTIVSSEAHFFTDFPEGKAAHPLEVLNDKAQFRLFDRYNITKLINVYLAREIGSLAGTGIVVNSVNPGFCRSTFMRNIGLFQYLFTVMKMAFARTTEMGSRTLVWAALHDTPQGAYSSSCTVEESSDYSLSKESDQAQARIWADLKEAWRKAAPHTAETL